MPIEYGSATQQLKANRWQLAVVRQQATNNRHFRGAGAYESPAAPHSAGLNTEVRNGMQLSYWGQGSELRLDFASPTKGGGFHGRWRGNWVCSWELS